MSKNQIRADMQALLKKISPEERHTRSLAACHKLLALKEFKSAQMVMIFMSIPCEIETTALAIRAWQEGKTIVVPRVDWKNNRMEPVEINSFEECEVAGKGIREPLIGTVVPLGYIDMVVVPGMSFDRCGFRVGRGKGFYDRFLAETDFNGKRVGFCFQEQLHPNIPTEPHDIPMDIIVTDEEVIHCHNGNSVNK